MTSALEQLRRSAEDRDRSVADLLVLAAELATKVKADELKRWAQEELSGYEDGRDVPAYRIVAGTPVASRYAGGKVVKINPRDTAAQQQLSRCPVLEAMPRVELLAATGKDPLLVAFPSRLIKEIARQISPYVDPRLRVSRLALRAIVDAARRELLKRIGELERNGIRGEETAGTKEVGSMRVLALFANPRGTNVLRLGEEDRVLQECIRRSKNRDGIQLAIRHAVTVTDARRALLDDNYDVVHFSGHGTGTGLAFEDSAGRLYVPPRDALAELLKEFAPPLECVLLNACYSTTQGDFTSLGLPFTIAMEGPIADDAAILFTGGFYDSLAAGKDVEFSFRQGVLALKLGNHPDSVVPRLIRQGEASVQLPSKDEASGTGAARHAVSSEARGASPLLLGVGIDVSGSMEKSINNRVGSRQSRLGAFRDALSRAASKAQLHLGPMGDEAGRVRLFGYAFGLRTGGVCDLFSLVKAADGLISQDEIEGLKRKHTSALERRYGDASGLESLARQYLGGGMVDSLKATARAQAETEVRDAIFAEVGQRLKARLDRIGETTLGLDQFLDLWKSSEGAIADAEGFIFGNTPMREALGRVKRRFEVERDRSGVAPNSVFLLVSDGESTDGDPTTIAAEIRDLGVTVVGCYITDSDVVEPRLLASQPGEGWSEAATEMFKMSSVVSDDSDIAHHLLREGWRIPKGARAFVQANHSELLEDLLAVVLSPIDSSQGMLPKGL